MSTVPFRSVYVQDGYNHITHNSKWDRSDFQRWPTCDHGGVILSTGDLSDAAFMKVLQGLWRWSFKQKGPMAQLAVPTAAEREHVLAWNRGRRVQN